MLNASSSAAWKNMRSKMLQFLNHIATCLKSQHSPSNGNSLLGCINKAKKQSCKAVYPRLFVGPCVHVCMCTNMRTQCARKTESTHDIVLRSNRPCAELCGHTCLLHLYAPRDCNSSKTQNRVKDDPRARCGGMDSMQ